jgi:hypothetical protein
MKKLTLRIVNDWAGIPILALCDEHGTPLPQQEELRIESTYDDFSRVTVTFKIDGNEIALVGKVED